MATIQRSLSTKVNDNGKSEKNLVDALSGHSVGNKAFARYREIDEDMKCELVNVMRY